MGLRRRLRRPADNSVCTIDLLLLHYNDEGHDLLITVSFDRQATQEPSQDCTRDCKDEERSQGEKEVENWTFWGCWWRVALRYHLVSPVCMLDVFTYCDS